VRVIAGRARGVALAAPPGDAVRPTADKLKGAIFSMLEAEAYKRNVVPAADAPEGTLLSGAAWPQVLDLYAGTGALAIEALSRGARWADLVEHDAAARKAIATNLARTRLAEYAAVHARSVPAFVSTATRTYDLILLDPPYADSTLPTVLEALGRATLVGPHGLVVYEHARDAVPPPTLGRLPLQKTRYHGGSGVSLYYTAGDPA
jgi:16S rRNA (guanine966-N2)-methyltransferase